MVSAIKSRWDWMSFFNRPLALALMVATIVVVILGIRMARRFREAMVTRTEKG